MKIGFGLVRVHHSQWIDATILGDQLGYESVWIPEHLVMPEHVQEMPYPNVVYNLPTDAPLLDAFTFLAFMAGQTSRLRLGTAIYNAGLRHPLVVARAVSTLDILSGGRLEFGVGVSWLEAEWKAVGLDFHTRGRRIDECLDVCKRLWVEPTIEHHGECFDFEPVKFEPKPLQKPHPPIVIGGSGAAAIRRAATIGNGWIPSQSQLTLEQVSAGVVRIAELRDEAGVEGNVEITWSSDNPSVRDIEAFAAAGIDRVIVKPWSKTREALDGLERFAEEVLPYA
jgi:probable F420-dependent oxidoreductase